MRVGDCVRALPSFQTWSLHLLFVLHCLICILQSSLKTISSSFHRILAVVVTNLSFSFFVIPLSLNQFFKTNKVTTVIHFVVDRKSNCHFEKGLCTDSLTGQPGNTDLYRFSAFWLRSKCSICSYQLNIWYGLHSRSRILNWFLTDWDQGWACSPGPAGCHGIALLPWVASSIYSSKEKNGGHDGTGLKMSQMPDLHIAFKLKKCSLKVKASSFIAVMC